MRHIMNLNKKLSRHRNKNNKKTYGNLLLYLNYCHDAACRCCFMTSFHVDLKYSLV